MWGHLPVANLITLQRIAKLATLDRAIKALHDEGYTVDADRLLDERIEYAEHVYDRAA